MPAGQRLRRRVRPVEDDESAIAEDAFEPAAEGVGHAGARGVRLAKVCQELRP